MITIEALKAADYKWFIDGAVSLKGDGCVCLWQKKVEDEQGLRYHVNVFEWDLKSVIPNYPGKSPFFQAEVQFRLGEGDGKVVNVSLPPTDADLAETELFFARMWQTMEFVHQERHSWVPDSAPKALP